MPFTRLFGRNKHRPAAHAAYLAIVEQARQPAFYAEHGVPDTIDGRFEMIALHVFLALNRLKAEPGAAAFGQTLFDVMFADMDRGLREMGTGDLSVGKQIRGMAEGFYGRTAAYDAGLGGDGERLIEGLRRNLYGTVEADAGNLAFMADYMVRQRDFLATQPTGLITEGTLRFTEPLRDRS